MAIPKHFVSEGAMVLAVAAMIAFGAGYVASGSLATGASAAGETDVLTWKGHLTIQQVRDGEVINTWEHHNILTMQGQQWIRGKISDGTSLVNSNATVDEVAITLANATFIALGNGSAPAAATQQLAQEIGVNEPSNGLERAEGSETYFPSAGEFQVQNTFTATQDIGVVNTTSLNWNSSGPSIVSGGAFGTEANILTDDQLTVTHNITIS